MKRPKITLAVPFAVFPPKSLESRRIFNFYRHLAQNFHIEIISLADAGTPEFKGAIAPGLTEIRVPKSLEHQQAETDMVQELGAKVADAALMKLFPLTPPYLSALKKSAKSAEYVLCYEPYLLPAIKAVCQKPLWYESTGYEAGLKRQLLPETEEGVEFWEEISRLELECCQKSELVITSSEIAKQELVHNLDITQSKIVVIPNGINTQRWSFTPYEQRLLNKEKLGIDKGFSAIFMGNGNPNNANEARGILNIASKLQDINFLLLGDVGIFFEPRLTPPNVRFIPSLDERTKSIIISTADVALNPVTGNPDNQMLILEYFCQGIPVISTPNGVQGLEIKDKEHCLIGEIWRFPELLEYCRMENKEKKEVRLKNSKKYVKNEFEWSVIAHKFLSKFDSHALVAG